MADHEDCWLDMQTVIRKFEQDFQLFVHHPVCHISFDNPKIKTGSYMNKFYEKKVRKDRYLLQITHFIKISFLVFTRKYLCQNNLFYYKYFYPAILVKFIGNFKSLVFNFFPIVRIIIISKKTNCNDFDCFLVFA